MPLNGKTKEEAQNILNAANLKLGKVTEEPQEKEELFGTVIKQKPSPSLPIAAGESVDVTIAIKKRDQGVKKGESKKGAG